MSDLRNNPYAAWAQGFSTIDADTLMYKPLPKSSFLVDGLIPQGVNILCGASKIGKSWMVLDLALKVSAGEPVWGIETTKCDVLYLCLEDTYQRIQDRLMKLTDEAPANLRFSVAANSLSGGLDKDIINYLYAYPETKLIIIDTLQKIRAEKDKFSGGLYARAYRWSISPARRSRSATATTEKKPRKEDKQKGAGKPAPVHRSYFLKCADNR